MNYGDIIVLNEKQNIFADYSFRTFQVTYGEETRKVLTFSNSWIHNFYWIICPYNIDRTFTLHGLAWLWSAIKYTLSCHIFEEIVSIITWRWTRGSSLQWRWKNGNYHFVRHLSPSSSDRGGNNYILFNYFCINVV